MSLPSLPANVQRDAKLFIFANATALEGKGELLAEALKICAEKSNSEEAGTLTYRVSRQLDKPDTFHIFEEYVNVAAFEAHAKGEAFNTLAKAGLVGGLGVTFTQESNDFKAKI